MFGFYQWYIIAPVHACLACLKTIYGLLRDMNDLLNCIESCNYNNHDSGSFQLGAEATKVERTWD